MRPTSASYYEAEAVSQEIEAEGRVGSRYVHLLKKIDWAAYTHRRCGESDGTADSICLGSSFLTF